MTLNFEINAWREVRLGLGLKTTDQKGQAEKTTPQQRQSGRFSAAHADFARCGSNSVTGDRHG
jgi:hypothetical protein